MKRITFFVFLIVFFACKHQIKDAGGNKSQVVNNVKTSVLVDTGVTVKEIDKDTLNLHLFGYRNGVAILIDEHKTLYEYHHPQGIIPISQQIGNNFEPLSINDSGIVYYDPSEEILLVVCADVYKKIPFKSKPKELVVNSTCTEIYFFHEYHKNVEKLEVHTGRITQMPFRGYGLNIIDDSLFFIGGSDDTSFSNVYCYNNEGEVVMIVEKVFDEGLLITPDKQFIACHIPVKGIAVKSVYSIDKKRFHLLDDERIKNVNYVLYVPDSKSFLYYDPSGFIYIEVSEPYSFDYDYNPR